MIPSEICLDLGWLNQQPDPTSNLKRPPYPWGSSIQVMISGWLYYLRAGTANDLPDEINPSASREQITLGKHTPSAVESGGEDATWKIRGNMLFGGGGGRRGGRRGGGGGGKKLQ